MSWLAVLSVVLCYSTLVLSDAESDKQMTKEFTATYVEALEAMGMSEDQITAPAANPPSATKGAKFSCRLPITPAPNTVHELSPEHVDVVAAMGDSVTAAFGARATGLIFGGLFTEFRGISWSIGGEGMIDTVMTLPNAIQYFNFDLKGFSTANGESDSPEAGLNVAVTGARTRDMLGQAQTLVSRMREQGVTDEQWKVITLWIGGNDLCDIGKFDSANTQARIFTDNVERALDYLSRNVKRAFINMVQMINVAELNGLRRFDCDALRVVICNGVSNFLTRGRVAEAARQYNQLLEDLIDNGKRFDRDDFTVVLQPFFTETPLPRLANGAPDFDFFAPDCFHFSQLGHNAVATYLWNNMFEPVGRKTTGIDWNDLQPLNCPINNPFFATYKNQNSNPAKSALIDSESSIVEGGSSSSALLTTSSFSLFVVAVVLSQFM